MPKQTLLITTLCLLASMPVWAQSKKSEVDKSYEEQYRLRLKQCESIVPRPAKMPVASMTDPTSAGLPLDTLNTADNFIKVVLYDNNTWKYVKLPDYQKDTGVFSKYWDTEVPNPYKLAYEDLPSAWSIWLVDSLNQYHCPHQGDVYARGKFGYRRSRRHQGVDLPYPTGTPVYAAFTGRVRMSKYYAAFGNLVIIRHENGIETFYGHLSKRMVEAGDWVNAGEIIGLGGSTGRSTGPHLHFECRYQGFAFDPQWLIDFHTGTLRHRLFVLKKSYFNPRSNYEQDFEDEIKNAEEDKKEDAEEAAKAYYKIRKGDTLGRIAINHHTSVKALCRLNNMKDTDILREGKTIRVR